MVNRKKMIQLSKMSMTHTTCAVRSNFILHSERLAVSIPTLTPPFGSTIKCDVPEIRVISVWVKCMCCRFKVEYFISVCRL
jgi:hypothetical protein